MTFALRASGARAAAVIGLVVAAATSMVAASAPAQAASKPLAGKVVVIDPGHDLGNFTHQRQIARKVNAGGFYKACNTTGTATVSGYRESTFAMSVASYLRARLQAQGARVYLTRYRESATTWGPCVDARGLFGARVHADAVVSIHADGTASRFHGFFVINPAYRRGWTDDIYGQSKVLARNVWQGLRSTGLPVANYYGGDGYDTRGDLGTLNRSNVPIVMVELGNMKNPTDARHMRSASWRNDVYAAGLARGIGSYLRR